MSERYFIVMSLQLWDDLKTGGMFPGMPVKVAKELGMGFLPVFSSREESATQWPGAAITEVQRAEEI